MTGGFLGKVLRVDLTSGRIEVEAPEEYFYRSLIGGRGFIAYTLLRELPRGADPLGPENVLVFATGVMTGTPMAGTGRHSVGAKSPLTGGYGDAEAGGFWGATLKRAGFDAAIIKGAATAPVYLLIDGGRAEIRPASHLWGKTTGDAQELLTKELGPGIRVAQCGPAGENLVRFACVVHDLRHVAARTGLGAVMGSKRLRAVVVRGKGAVPVADKEALAAVARQVPERHDHYAEWFRRNGTSGILKLQNGWGGLPTRNFRQGQFEHAAAIDGTPMTERLVKATEGCWACPIKCKRICESEEPYRIDGRYGGPEYETLAALGSCCGVGDLDAVCKAHEMCNALGLDTISMGVTVAFAMECVEKGLLQEPGAPRPGNAADLLRCIELTAAQEGIGRLLAQGTRRAAAQIGRGAENLAMHVKGQEIPMHDPRHKVVHALGYCVSPTGADHNHNCHDNAYTVYVDARSINIAPLGVLRPLPALELSPAKVRMLKYVSTWRHLHDCIGLCFFVVWDGAQVSRAVPAISGWDITFWELMKASERAQTLARCFNLREGFTAQDDVIPRRFSEPFTSGPSKGFGVPLAELERAKLLYYDMMGWDERGVPTTGTLAELDIPWAADILRQAGVRVSGEQL